MTPFTTTGPEIRASVFGGLIGLVLGGIGAPTLTALVLLAGAAILGALPLTFMREARGLFHPRLWRAWGAILAGRSNLPQDAVRVIVAYVALTGFLVGALAYFAGLILLTPLTGHQTTPNYDLALTLGATGLLANSVLKGWVKRVRARQN